MFMKILLLLFLIAQNIGTVDNWPILKGPYLGQKPPGMKPEVFAPGFISTNATEFANTFSQDGKEFYFTRVEQKTKKTVIMFSKMENNQWSKPQPATFSNKYNDFDPLLSPDNKMLLYSSNRPVHGKGKPKGDYDNWYVERNALGWSEPKHLGSIVNSQKDEFYPCLTQNGTLYFISFRYGGLGEGDFYRSQRLNGEFSGPENLGSSINTEYREGDGFIAPDERFFIFSAFIPGNFGGGDLYISFRKCNGLWTKAKNLGKNINSKGNEFTPVITSDGKYLFFASDRSGNDEIYWADAKIIEDLKPKELK